MQKKVYTRYNETLWYETLSNGMKVNILPKPDFHKTYAMLTADFGSLNTSMIVDGQTVKIPAGTAHFLEHKLFEKEDYDAFDLFGKNGADSNAFTSYSKTSYLFTATSHINENLQNLLTFVQRPYFSEKSVQKEQGIIGQEIQMYADEPDWQLYMGMLNNLYHNNPLSNDIAGTVESIKDITPNLLYQVHQRFYQPKNLNLFIVGNVDVQVTIDEIRKIEAEFDSNEALQPIEKSAVAPVILKKELELDIARPKTMLGLRNNQVLPAAGTGRLKYMMQLDLAFYLLFSSSSDLYLDLYDLGIIDDTFGYEVNSERDNLFITMGGDSDQPDILINKIKTALQQGSKLLESQSEAFELARREMIGRDITKMNSLEAIANSYEGIDFGETNIFDEIAIYELITLEDVIDVYQEFIKNTPLSTFELKVRN